VRGLRALGVHGALPEEQERAQPFEVDVDLAVDLRRAGATDALADTVDYGSVLALVAEVVGSEHHQLLERLGARIAERILDHDARIEAVTVTVRKLRPPVPVDLASVAVSLTRRSSSVQDGSK
jgi:dihydroneopterin aldolase